MDTVERYGELIEDIYSAPFTESGWTRVVHRLRREFDSTMAYLHVCELSECGTPLSVLEPFEPAILEQYFEYYWSVDPRFDTARKGDNRPRTRQEIVPDKAFRQTEIYNDYLARLEVEQNIVVPLKGVVSGANFLSLMRPERQGHYDARHVARLKPLVRHLQKALLVQKHLVDARRHTLAAAEVLDRLDYGILFVDAAHRVIHMNRRAREIVGEEDGLCVGANGRFRAEDQIGESALSAAIESVMNPPAGDAVMPSGTLILQRSRGKTPLEVVVSPAPAAHYGDISPDIRAVVIISDPDSRVDVPRAYLRKRYALTPAECNIALALVNGVTLNEYSERANVKLSTSRTQLKHLLHKCGATRQSDLVRLLLRSPLAFIPDQRVGADDRDPSLRERT